MKIQVLAISIVLLWASTTANSQETSVVELEDIQSWNDIQVTVPMSKSVDFWTSATVRLGKDVSRLNDGRYAIGFIYKPNKNWSIQPFFWGIKMRNSRGQFRNESRLNFRIGYKFPIKPVAISHRSTFEYRVRNSGNSWRYRPSLTFEKELPRKLNGKLYLNEEVFYDSALGKFSRNRLTIGFSKTLNEMLLVDLYFMRQNDRNARPGDLNVVGTSWKIRL